MRSKKNMAHNSESKGNPNDVNLRPKKKRDEFGRHSKKKTDILIEIGKAPNGLSIKELHEKTGISSSHLKRLINEIRNDALIDGSDLIVKPNKKAKLILSSQIAKNTRSKANIFRLESTREILGGTLSSSLFPGDLDLPQEFKELKQKEDSFVDSLYKCRTDLTKESKLLYEFSLNIAKIITFFLCNAIKPPTNDEEREWTKMIKTGNYLGIQEWKKKRVEDTYSWLSNSIDLQTVFNEFIRQNAIVKGIITRKIQLQRSIRKTQIEQLTKEIDTKIRNITNRQAKNNQSKLFRKTQIEQLTKEINTRTEIISRINLEANLSKLFDETNIQKWRQMNIEELRKYNDLSKDEITKIVNKKRIGLNALIPNHETDYKTFQNLQDGYNQIWPYTYMVLENLRIDDKLSHKVADNVKSYYRSEKQEKEMQKKKQKKKI